MRVLIATSTFPRHTRDSATPRFVLDLADAIARHVSVTVLAPGAPGAEARERWGALEVRRFDYFHPRRLQRLAYAAGMPENLRRSWWARGQVAGFLACEARALGSLTSAMRADVVHSHWLLPQGLAAAWARGRAGRFAHVTTLHGSDAHLLERFPGARSLARWINARSDAVIAAATPLRDRLDIVLGHSSGATVLPVGVNTALFRSALHSHVASTFPDGHLLFVGRLVPIKGLDVLLRALQIVRKRIPGLGLVVLGGGPEAPSLRETSRSLGLDPWVNFAGTADRATVSAQLQACRSAVLPSVVDRTGHAEGMPAVVLEALASGARLIATDAGGIPDVVVPGYNGWLARPGDPGDLAATILRALEAPVPPGAQKTADAHDWSVVAERHLAIYEGALRRAAA
jgi:glycosyltransferase involved in cell wall biosynthesis